MAGIMLAPTTPDPPIARSVFALLRSHALLWGATALLPLPALLASDPATSFEVACVYLGIACAWLSSDITVHNSLARDSSARTARLAHFLALTVAVETNVALFIFPGVTTGVQSHFPLPLAAFLASLPALGLVPFLTRRMNNRYAALLAAATIALGCKLTGCIVARMIYGSRFRELGYVDADWRNARLMIAVFWTLLSALSVSLAAIDGFGARLWAIRSARKAAGNAATEVL